MEKEKCETFTRESEMRMLRCNGIREVVARCGWHECCKVISCWCNNFRELVLKPTCLARDKSLSVATNARSF